MKELGEVIRRVTSHAQAVTPLDHDLLRELGELSSVQLFHALAPSKVRDVLYKLPPEMAKHSRRAFYAGESHLTLTWTFRRKLRYGSTRPSAYKVLTALRRQREVLLAEANERVGRRLRHVIQVQMTPRLVRDKMMGPVAVTFSASRHSVDIPERPVPLDGCRAQWLTCVRPADLQSHVTALLREAPLRVDPDTHRVEVCDARSEYDFSYAPVKGGRPGRQILQAERVVTYENALALHEGLEEAVVTGLNFCREPELPRVLVAASGADDLSSRDMTDALSARCAQLLSAWWAGYRGAPVDGLPRSEADSRLDPWAWARFLAQEDVQSRLMMPTASAEGYLEQLGDDAWADFAASVFRSELRRAGRHLLVPLEYFNQHSSQDPVRRCAGRLFLEFPVRLCGRDAYYGGALRRLPRACAVQVMESASEGAKDDESENE